MQSEVWRKVCKRQSPPAIDRLSVTSSCSNCRRAGRGRLYIRNSPKEHEKSL